MIGFEIFGAFLVGIVVGAIVTFLSEGDTGPATTALDARSRLYGGRELVDGPLAGVAPGPSSPHMASSG